jgi:hypothetical protein
MPIGSIGLGDTATGEGRGTSFKTPLIATGRI